MKSPITTHVLDTARGQPAAGVPIRLERLEGDAFVLLGEGATDDDGRLTNLLEPGTLVAGTYRITFETGAYLSRSGTPGFYPYAQVVFTVEQTSAHYHVPLLLSPYGYATYRGS